MLDWRHGVGRLTPDDAYPLGFSWRISPVQYSIAKQRDTGEIMPAMRVSDKAGAAITRPNNGGDTQFKYPHGVHTSQPNPQQFYW